MTHIQMDADAIVGGAPVQLSAQLPTIVRKDEQAKLYVSHIPGLDVYSQGRTEHEAVLALEQALRSYIVIARDRGLLERILLRSTPGLTDDSPVPAAGQPARVARDRPEPGLADTPAVAEPSAF